MAVRARQGKSSQVKLSRSMAVKVSQGGLGCGGLRHVTAVMAMFVWVCRLRLV